MFIIKTSNLIETVLFLQHLKPDKWLSIVLSHSHTQTRRRVHKRAFETRRTNRRREINSICPSIAATYLWMYGTVPVTGRGGGAPARSSASVETVRGGRRANPCEQTTRGRTFKSTHCACELENSAVSVVVWLFFLLIKKLANFLEVRYADFMF